MKILGKELTFNGNKVYHAGNKPTASEIGAAASSHTHNYAGSSSAGGNANAAVKLATARTINGTNFDGSANITTANWGTARNIQIGNTSKSVNGSANVSWSLSEIGAAAASHGRHIPDVCETITDWNNATKNGWYMGNNATNSPTANAWYFGEVIAHNANYVVQTVYQFTASTDAKAMPKYIRAKMNGTWGAWTNVTVSKAVPSNAVFTDTNTWRGVQDNLTSTATDQSLSANQGKVLKGLIDGKAASNHTHSYLPLSGGTLTGNIKFSGGGYNNHAIRMEAGDANGAFIGIGAGGLTVIGSGESTNAVRTALTNGADETMIVASDQTIRFLTGLQNGYDSAKEVSINTSGVINAPQGMTGNASTATKLQTVRSINGTNFDGSANITTANWGTARNIQIGNTAKSVNGSGNVTWSLSEIGAVANANGAANNITLGKYATFADYDDSSILKKSYLRSGVWTTEFTDIKISNNLVYHAGRKPTASEVGALATSGGTMSGHLTLNNAKGVYGKTAEALTNSEGATVAAGTSGALLVYNGAHNLHLGSLVYDNNLVTGSTYLNGAVNMFLRTNKGYVAMQPERTSTMTFYKTYSNTNVPLRSSVSAGTYLAGNQGTALLNSTASAGAYTTLIKSNSTNGYFTLNSYQQGMFLSYTAKSTVDAGTNAVTKTVKLIDEAGNTQFPGTVTASAFSGNATSATKLQTARTINGTNFDGSGNITTANWGTARTIKIGNTAKSVNGSANVTWTAAEIGVASIDDSTTATGTVWSSNKTQVQINTSYNTMSQKVDALEESINRDFVSKNGSTMTGDLTIKKSNGAAAKLNVHRTINSNDMQGTIDIYAHNGGSVALSTNNKTSGKQTSSYVFGGDAFWSPRNADGTVPSIGLSNYRFEKAWLNKLDAKDAIFTSGNLTVQGQTTLGPTILNNNTSLYGYNTSGTQINICGVDNSNNIYLGWNNQTYINVNNTMRVYRDLHILNGNALRVTGQTVLARTESYRQIAVVSTAGDGNGKGDGQTHLGYYDSGYHHYFRGSGAMHVDMLGGLRIDGKRLSIGSAAHSNPATGDVWIQI